MKIIFDSEEQMYDIIRSGCPSSIGLNDSDMLCERNLISCVDCWKRAVQIEIKSDKEETIGMTKEKEITYTDAVYELIKDECEGMDAIYEDYIVGLVGRCGLGSLKRAGLVEGCGTINCRQLYVLCDKKEV